VQSFRMMVSRSANVGCPPTFSASRMSFGVARNEDCQPRAFGFARSSSSHPSVLVRQSSPEPLRRYRRCLGIGARSNRNPFAGCRTRPDHLRRPKGPPPRPCGGLRHGRDPLAGGREPRRGRPAIATGTVAVRHGIPHLSQTNCRTLAAVGRVSRLASRMPSTMNLPGG
jgi:hypothetical protein